MFFLSFFLILVFLIVFLLNVVSLLIAESSVLNREELSSYECGFEHNNLSRVPFSFRYFVLTLVFLLFDLEVVLLLCVAYLSSFGALLGFSVFVCLLFSIILLLGLLVELNIGGLDWIS